MSTASQQRHHALAQLFAYVHDVPGCIIFDEYSAPAWPGETKAVDDFVAREQVPLLKFTAPYGPNAYVVKP